MCIRDSALGEAVGKALTGDFAGAAAAVKGIGSNIATAWGTAMDSMTASSQRTADQVRRIFTQDTAAGSGGGAGPGSKGYKAPPKAEKEMGIRDRFSAVFYNQYAGKTMVLKLNQNVLGKLAMPRKNDDFTMTDMDAEAFADTAGSVGYLCQY